MAFLDEAVSILANAGLGAFNTDIFASSSSRPPKRAQAVVTLVENSAGGPEGTHNDADAGKQGYERVMLQVVARATLYEDAKAYAERCALTIAAVRNTFISGVWWRSARLFSGPIDMGKDANDKAMVSYNLLVTKRFSVDITSPTIDWREAEW